MQVLAKPNSAAVTDKLSKSAVSKLAFFVEQVSYTMSMARKQQHIRQSCMCIKYLIRVPDFEKSPYEWGTGLWESMESKYCMGTVL